ncbi:MAG: PorV/PorQ family protein, partial [Candidatus Zixiibacteriota bacterium]
MSAILNRRGIPVVCRILKKIVIVWIILVVLVALAGDVTVAAADGGRTAASFLNIGIGARAAGMGGAYTAVADGAPAIYWNPAGLANLRQSEVMLSHFAWYQDITLEHGSAAIPVREDVNLGFGITYMNYGKINGFDINGQPTGELSAYDLAGSVGIGARLSDRVSAGLAVKIIRQQLHTLDASAFAADVGLRYSAGKIQ